MTQAEVKSSPGGARIWRLSSGYIKQPTWICFRLLMHKIACARILAWLSAGKSMAARMAMIAMTTSSSIKVKAGLRRRFIERRIGRDLTALLGIPSDEPEEFWDGISNGIGDCPVVDLTRG